MREKLYINEEVQETK